jgi:hypothetical protein
MAKKKSEATETQEFRVDVSKLTLKMEKYIDSLGRFIMEHIPNTDVTRDGNVLKVKAPQNMSKRILNLRVSKFLYQSGLKDSYRVVSMQKADGNGYQILEF